MKNGEGGGSGGGRREEKKSLAYIKSERETCSYSCSGLVIVNIAKRERAFE
jgi:hypothetical protein